MTYEDIKKWLEENNYQNSGLRIDRNHRIDLYLSDVLFDFAQQQVKNLNIPAVISSFVCGHPPKQTYLNDGIWHCEKCGGKWKSIANK
jgi:hypothetical protein